MRKDSCPITSYFATFAPFGMFEIVRLGDEHEATRMIDWKGMLRFIEKVNKLSGNRLVSVILFGSTVDKTFWLASDVDILFVFDDSVSDRALKLLRKLIRAYFDQERIKSAKKGILSWFLRTIENQTGMYVSGFATRLKELRRWDFAKIFSVNAPISRMIAPRAAVKYTLKRRYKVIYGKDVISELPSPRVNVLEIIKSLIMNMLLAIFALIIAPHPESYKYSMEAVKWSIYATTYAIDSKPDLYRVGKLLSDWGANFIRKYFLPARRSGRYHALITLLAPINVIKIHSLAIKYRKRE